MKLDVLQADLSKALNLASRFVNARAQLPVLANILFQAKKTKLIVSATNLEMSIAIAVGAKVSQEGKITVPARTITDLVASLSANTISLAEEKERLKIKTEGFSGNVAAANASDFPSVPQSLGKPSFDLDAGLFVESLEKVVYSASIDETRPVLTGVLFIFEKDQVVLVSSDGFRLSRRKVALTKKGAAKTQKIILPRVAVSELARIAGAQDQPISMHVGNRDNQVVFGLADSVFASRMIEGEFPDFERIIPKSISVKVNLDKNDFKNAIKTAAVIAREAANVISIKIKDKKVSISATSPKSGETQMSLDAKVEGEDLEITYNYRFIEEFLNVAQSDDVVIEFSGNNTPAIFRDTKDPNYLHLIMPVKIQG